jgi:hypothetical protein
VHKIKDRIPPALFLYLLSPVIGELLSGSAPPAEFFTPFGFTIMTLLYGGGAVVCRELKIRWRKGMVSLLLLGMAYAVLEEGLMVASFQNPEWMDLGILGIFGRWLGINWVWAVELTFYHSIISIIVPVMIVELIYYERVGESWLSNRWFLLVSGLLIADVIVGLLLFATMSGFWPPLPQYVFMIAVTLTFIVLAKRLPVDYARRGVALLRRPRYYLILTIFAAFTCGIIFWILPNSLQFPMAPLIVILFGILVVLGYIRFLISHKWVDATPLHRYGLVSGALAPLILSAFIQEFDNTRVDDTSGMALVGVFFFLSLMMMQRSLRKQALSD